MALTGDGLALAECIRKDQPLAFVGAGTSARLNYPTWGALIERMEAEVKTQRGATMSLPNNADLLWRAEEYRDLLSGGDYEEFLRATFPTCPNPRDGAIVDLIRMPFRHVLTTNYDDVLEQTHLAAFGAPARSVDWADERALRDFIWGVGDRVDDVGRDRQYLHLHGTIADLESIVLTDRDYTERYLGSDATARKLFAIFATQRVVFVGFGLSDPDFMEILRIVRHTMGPGRTRHYAIIPIRAGEDTTFSRRRLAKKFGVTPVFYEESPDHRGLAEVLRGLRQHIDGDSASAVESPSALESGTELLSMSSIPPARPETTDALGLAAVLDDPQKGKWGGKPERNGRGLFAEVEPLNEGSDDWFRIQLQVRRTDPKAAPLRDAVRFHLHDSFDDDDVEVQVKGGVASLQLVAFGAFTVGVEADNGRTALEIDLAELEGAPTTFRSR